MTKKSGTNTNTNTNGNNCSSRPPLPPSSPARHQDSDGKKMNGGSHSYSYYYRNNGNNTPSPFNESIASSLSANSEQFTTMSASEASSILEQHIARHPIQSEADFHYIAELLKNFENEEDLKRIAELLRASDPKFQQQQQQQPQRTAPTVEDEQEFEKGKKKKKSKMAKKAKKAKKKKHRKKEPSIVSEDGNEDYESEDSSNSSDDDEDDDGSYSSSSSSSSSRSTGEDLFEDDYITSSSSSTITSDKRRKRKKEKQKEKQRKRKEKKRKRLEREREKEKQRKREKKERKRLKKEKKQLKKKGKKKMKLQQQLEGGIDNTPPAQIHVIGEEEERETWDDEDAIVSNEISHQRTIAKKDGDIERNQATGELLKSTVANKAGKQPSPSSGSSKDQEKIVASTPSKTDLEDLDKSKTLREIFEDNSQKAPAPDRKAKEEEKRHAIVPEEQAKPSPDESPTEIFQDEVHEDSSKRNENEIEDLMASFPYPGMIQNNKRPSARSSGQRQQMLDSDNSLVLEESFGNDHARQSSSKGMPSLPEDGVPEFTPMDSSKSLPSSKNPTKEKSEEISQDSWAQPEGSSWKGDPELGIQRTASSRHAPSLPTIFSSTRESLCSAQDEENDNRVGELADHPEKQQGGRESKSSGDDSTTSSRDLPEDELENLAMHFSASLNENIPKPAVGDANRGKGGYSTLPQNDSNNNDARKNTEYPPVITETSFARQESSTMARHVVPLPSSKLNASLVFGRQPSTSVLNKTLELSRKTSSETYKGLSSSVLRPPSTRRLDSGVVSTQDFDAMRDAMRASHQSAQVMESGEIFHAKVDIEPTIQSPLIVQADDSPAEGIPSREMIQAELTVKPRLLCLHGWRSNAEITRLQLENLGLLDFFDPIFIEGPHISDKPADDAVSLLSQGPYYSWLNQMSTFHSEDEDGNGQQSATFESSRQRKSNRSWKGAKTLRQSLYNFRQVMGDSGGRSSDEDPATEELLMSLKAVMMHLLTESRYLDAFSQENEEIANIPCYDAVYGFSQGATLVTLLSYEFVRNQILEEMNLPPMNRMPWKFVISACAANVSMKELLAYHFEMNFEVKLPLPSVHLIGLSDTRKGQSEAIMKEHYNQQQVFPIYLDSGHGIPAATRKLSYILDEIINWFLLKIALPDLDISNVPVESDSENVSMLHIMNSIDKIQREHLEEFPTVAPELDVGKLHIGSYGQYIINTIHSSHCNLMEMLEAANPRDICFLAPEAKPLTYGGMLDFIRGDGDLRRVGAQSGFTVAYVAPFGVVSATAFIVVASQCPAAPLDPGYNESDLLLAFEQLKPDLVLTFDGVDSGLVQRVALGQGLRVAHATVQPRTCGLFQLKSLNVDYTPDLDLSIPLVNHADNNGLILRTSGTTSKPKVVPLKLWAIVSNSYVIAKNLGLRKTDIALNAMPLFHIGGLSANLLSSLAAGASVILLPQFNAADFFDYLTSPEEPRPTWYSAVPTMHAAIHQFSEDSIFKTSLRFIRSGAAAMPMDLAATMEETFNCPLILTYSMTEQMPISQPPTGYSIPKNKPNSVGQPVCVSMCIVDKNLRPVPYFTTNDDEDNGSAQTVAPISGEVCISGPMVVEGYMSNPQANAGSFFRIGGMDWFRTGDMGYIDKEGFLFLTGRSKELIKRGGDQVSPYEVEDAIYGYPDVKTAVVFAIPDPIWGERVGAAIILKDGIQHEQIAFTKELANFLKKSGLQPFKVPEQVVLVKEEDLPKTRSNKYIRIGLAKALGLNAEKARDDLKGMRAVHYHEAAAGVKFFLAWAVTYVHIGNFDDRNLSEYSHSIEHPFGWEHTRSWCWHNPIFFLVGGFLLAAGTHVPVTNWKDLKNFYSLRIAGLHPMYLLSILFCTVNFVARCHPSNYISEFDRLREPLDGEYFVCQSTPIEWSYYPTLVISIISYACTFQSWPFMMPFGWFLSYYTWFSSVYIFCIFVFPWIHQQYYHIRDDIGAIWKLNFFWIAMNYLYVAGIASLFGMEDETLKNYFAVSSYLFPPGWVPCCALGVGCYFLFRHYRPSEKANAWVWGAITDTISVLLLAGWLFYGLEPYSSIPSWLDDSMVKRHWDPFLSRILSPIGFLWFWGLAVGTGYTASLFSLPFVVEWLAPASYNMFLFHQPISEWYYLATRSRWWAYPKNFYWFSPYPYPVRNYEFFVVTGFVIALSVFMEAYANEWMVANFAAGLNWLTGGGMSRKSKEGESTLQVVQSIIHELTFADAEPETSLTEAGLSSMTTIILVSEIKKVYKSLKLTVRDVINSETVGELVDVIEGRMKEHANRPELALGKRTAVVAPKALKASMGGENAFEGSRAGGASGKMSTDSSKPGAPERRKSIAQIHFTGYDDQQSARSIKSQASRRHSMKSTRSTRSRGAGFSIDGGMPEAQTRRRASVQLSDGHGSFVSRTSSRMSFTIPASGNAASRRNTGMTTVSTTGFARKQGTRRPNNQFDGFTPPRQLS